MSESIWLVMYVDYDDWQIIGAGANRELLDRWARELPVTWKTESTFVPDRVRHRVMKGPVELYHGVDRRQAREMAERWENQHPFDIVEVPWVATDEIYRTL